MDIVKSISEIFFWPDADEAPMMDFTEYKVITNTHEYTGTIIYQNDFVIKFQCRNSKLVKILKLNIVQMVVIDYPGVPNPKRTRYV